MTKSSFVCQQCGYSQVGWAGKCPNCGSWGSLVETLVSPNSKFKIKNSKLKQITKPVSLSSISSQKTQRISSKIPELDRVLGGGLVPGQAVLIAGIPGIGKSTILLQLSANLGNVLYVAGEESAGQIKIRSERLGLKGSQIQILEETNVDLVIELASEQKDLKGLIIDSIQTVYTSDLTGMAGSIGQVRESAFRLVQFAKKNRVPTFLVGHVTKEGSVAGPAVLAHVVDTVLWFDGDSSPALRILRAHKNRFGPTDEVGIFMMQEKGLISVENANSLFLSHYQKPISGSVVTSILQGTRPILVEIQALVTPSKLAIPRRIAQGIDPKRLEVILAVLGRRCGIYLNDYDAFINVAGGISVKETGADLAIALSIVSAYFDKPFPRILVLGEVGLMGEIRQVSGEERRIKEAKRVGFSKTLSSKDIKFVREAIKKYF